VKRVAIRVGLVLAAMAVVAIGIVVIETPLGYIFRVKDFARPRNMFETALGWFALFASINVAVRFYRLFAMRLCKPEPPPRGFDVVTCIQVTIPVEASGEENVGILGDEGRLRRGINRR